MGPLQPRLLGIETFVLLCVIPAVGTQDRAHSWWWAALVGLLAVLLGGAPALLKRLDRRGAVVAGWVLQALFLATGLLTWAMWVVGAAFVALWALAMHLEESYADRWQPPAGSRGAAG